MTDTITVTLSANLYWLLLVMIWLLFSLHSVHLAMRIYNYWLQVKLLKLEAKLAP